MSNDHKFSYSAKLKLMYAISRDPRLRKSTNPIAVASVLIDHTNSKSGRCNPGLSRIIAVSGVPRSSMVKAIKTLEKTGWLSVDRTGRTNSYTIHNSSTVGTISSSLDSSSVGTSSERSSSSSKNLQRGTTVGTEVVRLPEPEQVNNRKKKNRMQIDDLEMVIKSVIKAYQSLMPCAETRVAITATLRDRIEEVELLRRALGTTNDRDKFWIAYFEICAEDPWMRGDIVNEANPEWTPTLRTLIGDKCFERVMYRGFEGGRNS